MRFKVFALFLAIQIASFGLWSLSSNQSPWHAANVVAAHEVAPKAPVSAVPAVQESLHLSFSSRDMGVDDETLNSIQQNQIITALAQLPAKHAEQVKNITLDYSPEAHRGLGGNHLIILRAVNMTLEEFVGVLIHEVGHNVDYGYLTGTDEAPETSFKDGDKVIRVNDPSYLFYRLSWEDAGTMKTAATSLDFVSGYAMADPFEDFAETYIYYILHNRDFKVLATSNEVLRAKYEFMKESVFGGEEFDSGTGEVDTAKRPWDTTVLEYDLNAFLG